MKKDYDFCYHLPEEIAEIDGIHYYCADRLGVSDFEGDAVFNLTGFACIPQLNIPQLASHVDVKYKEIVVAWPDFGIARVKPTFWSALHGYIKSQKWTKVCIHCEGGHGRTGTAIAALFIAVAEWDVPMTIEYIRSTFCQKMVESPEQMAYLCKLDEILNDRVTETRNIPLPSMIIEAQKREKENAKKLLNKACGFSYNIDEEK